MLLITVFRARIAWGAGWLMFGDYFPDKIKALERNQATLNLFQDLELISRCLVTAHVFVSFDDIFLFSVRKRKRLELFKAGFLWKAWHILALISALVVKSNQGRYFLLNQFPNCIHFLEKFEVHWPKVWVIGWRFSISLLYPKHSSRSSRNPYERYCIRDPKNIA